MTYQDWHDMFTEYVNMSDQQLINMAFNTADTVHAYLSASYGHGRACRFLAEIFATFAVLDGKHVTREEYELFRKVMQGINDEYYSFDEFAELAYDCYDDCRSISLLREEFGSYYDEDFKTAVIELAVTIATIDGTISGREQEVITALEQF